MSIHDDIQEMLPAFTVGALETDETARVESHLDSCDRCTRVLEEYRPVASALALTVRLAAPPLGLKARTMRRAMTEQAAKEVEEPAVHPALIQWRSWFAHAWLAPAFAGAVLVVVLVALAWNTWQSIQFARQIQDQRDLMTLVAYAQGTAQVVRGTERAPDAVGRLYLDFDSSVAALVTVDMPALPSGRTYQVWLTDAGGAKTNGGSFQLDSEGNGWILVRAPKHLSAYVQVGVTDEPTGGSSGPTTKPVLLAELVPQ